MLKPLTVWITTNCGKFLKRWKYQTILPVSWETCMQVKKQQLEPDMEQWTPTLGKEYDRLYIVTLLCYCCCSVAQSSLTLCSFMDHSMPGFPVLHYLPELAPLSWWCHPTISSSFSPSPLVISLSQHQVLLQWVSSLHQMAKVLKLQLQHQSFQWIIFRVDFHKEWLVWSPCCPWDLKSLFLSLYAEYTMWNAGLDKWQAGNKTARRNINNLGYANNTNLMAESEEELKSLLMRMEEGTEKAGLKFSIKKQRSWHLVPSLHGK